VKRGGKLGEQDNISLDNYKIEMEHEVVDVSVYQDKEGFSHYDISIKNISKTTNIILSKIREEFISRINIGEVQLSEAGEARAIKDKFRQEILILIRKYFPKTDKRTTELLISELIRQNIGLGDMEILLKDPNLEEIVINTAAEPIRVYHKKYGWLKTNIFLKSEAKIRHYATMIGRDVGKEITLLNPLMDAHLLTGDRVNSTLSPISTKGNTITIRKFAEKPWTITDFIKANTINYEGAALMWMAVQNELSMIISGGTGSGKTSMLNVVCSFIPINQRVISIEDTRELILPNDLHWVPLETRLPNPEGKGEVTMLDLVVNSLRMRPDRIIMGEVRRKREAEVLFEAMHTGHSVYATIHANNVKETIERLTNPPIDVPKNLLNSVSLIVSQNRNRRLGYRRTFQIAEVLPKGEYRILFQHDPSNDSLNKVAYPEELYRTLQLYTGLNKEDIELDLENKVELLKWLVKNDVTDINENGAFFRKYYVNQK
jgi:flagellar protein FlaI